MERSESQTGNKRRRQRDSDPDHSEGPLRSHFKQDPGANDPPYRPASPGTSDSSNFSTSENIRIKPDPDSGLEVQGATPDPTSDDVEIVEETNSSKKNANAIIVDIEVEETSDVVGDAANSCDDDTTTPAPNPIPEAVDYRDDDTDTTLASNQLPGGDLEGEVVGDEANRCDNGTITTPVPNLLPVGDRGEDRPAAVETFTIKCDPEGVVKVEAEVTGNVLDPELYDAEGRPRVAAFFQFTTKPLPKIEPMVKNESSLPPPAAPQVPHYNLHSAAEEREYVQHGPTQPIIYAGADNDEQEEFADPGPPLFEQQRYFKRKQAHAKYNFDQYNYPNLQQLAVYQYKEKILEAIQQNGVVVVEGFTGCGKTTQVPQFILDHCVKNVEHHLCNIAVTQPRRLATITVANRVCNERGWEIGGVVGYQVGMEAKSNRDTIVTYMTTGVLLQKLIQSKSLVKYTHIIIDEVHERDLETDFLLLVIKKILMDDKTGQERRVKIVLMSATLNADKFSKYFSIQRGRDADIEEAPIIKIPLSKSKYDVEEAFLDDLVDGEDLNELEFSLEKAALFPSVYDIAVKVIVDLDNVDRRDKRGNADPRLKGAHYAHMKPENRGSVLVFLPGYAEIDTLSKRLQEENRSHMKNTGNEDYHQWNIILLHSSITAEDQNRAFETVTAGYRKIILSTNIAESSITVPDVVYVIDFCLTKSQNTDPRTNFTCLRIGWASISQCIQRKGRTGRVAKGKVFRMVPKSFYSSLEKETNPEMLRAGLESAIVRVKSLGMGSPKEMLALAIDAPLLSGIERAVVNLKELGGLTIFLQKNYQQSVYDTCDGDLTFLGKLMSQLPVPHQCVRLIMFGHALGVLKEAIIIAAGLSVKSPFNAQFNKKMEAFTSRQRWTKTTYSDCLAILHLYLEWSTNHDNQGQGRALENAERTWARQAFAHLSALREIKTVVGELHKRLTNMNIVPFRASGEDSDEVTKEIIALLKVAIAGAFYPNYFHRRRPEKGYERERSREVGGENLFSTVYFTGFPPGHHGTLYAKHIADKLADGKDIPKVTFQGQKVFVNFESSSEKIGPVSRSVYRAVKLRQIRSKVEFNALRKEEGERYLQEQQRRVQASGQYYVHCPPQVNVPSVAKSEFYVKVTHVENPGQFWIIYEEFQRQLDELEALINGNPNQRLQQLREEEICPGAFCLAPYDSDGYSKVYYRARIRSLTIAEVLVYFVDYGNSKWISIPDLCSFTQMHFNQKVHERPCMAIECRLACIKPSIAYGSVWHERATRDFTMFSGRVKMKYKVYSVVKNVIIGTLYGVETGPVERVFDVNQKLVLEKYADEVKESFVSERNHESRMLIMSRNAAISAAQIQSLDKEQADPMTDTIFFDPPRKNAVIPIELKGPWSPLELNFQSLCHSSSTKQVVIDDNSVNSVALDHEPSAPTSRLVVASSVGIQDRSGRVVARDTTMMPAIPGIMSLMSMIFSPKIELRVDGMKSRYTGVLCGLGMDPDFKSAIYQDHDMEVVFDTAIDNDDIYMINRIRHLFNFILRGGDQAGNLVPTHANLRDAIFKLLRDKDRKPMEETWPRESYSWNQIPRQSIIPPESIDFPTEPLDIFLPHSYIALQGPWVPKFSWGDHAV